VTARKLVAEIKELRLESREHQRRANELMEEIRGEMRLNREVIRRNELAFQENSRVLSGLVEMVREMKEEVRAQTEEVRAQARAIFKLIDRLDGGTAPA
jgi:methyl-accepting chemotaxis protein